MSLYVENNNIGINEKFQMTRIVFLNWLQK